MLNFGGGGNPKKKQQKTLAFKRDGHIAAKQKPTKSSHLAVGRCCDDGHAGLHVFGFVLVEISTFFSRERMVEMMGKRESRGFSKANSPRKLTART